MKKCGREYPVEYNVCPLDSTVLQSSDPPTSTASAGYPPPPYPVQPQPRKGLPVWAWVLIGVGAFLFIVVPILLALIAIPTIGSIRKKANDISAIRSIQVIVTAESAYEASYPANGFACSLKALGGDPNSGPPNPNAAQLIQPELASGVKSGYIFKISTCTKVNVSGTDRITGYTVTAVPQRVGVTGDRGFCADESGVIKFDPAGSTNCTQAAGGDDQ